MLDLEVHVNGVFGLADFWLFAVFEQVLFEEVPTVSSFTQLSGTLVDLPSVFSRKPKTSTAMFPETVTILNIVLLDFAEEYGREAFVDVSLNTLQPKTVDGMPDNCVNEGTAGAASSNTCSKTARGHTPAKPKTPLASTSAPIIVGP